MSEKKMYYPLANDPKQRYPLKVTSKGNIRQLAAVCSKRIRSEEADRADWAEQAGDTPFKWLEVRIDAKTNKLERFLTEEEKKVAAIRVTRKPLYQVEDVYTEYYIHAALAPVLFDGFKEILDVSWPEGKEKEPKITILDQDAFDNLKEDVVNQAFLDFAGKRNPTSKALNEFLARSINGQNNLGELLQN